MRGLNEPPIKTPRRAGAMFPDADKIKDKVRASLFSPEFNPEDDRIQIGKTMGLVSSGSDFQRQFSQEKVGAGGLFMTS